MNIDPHNAFDIEEMQAIIQPPVVSSSHLKDSFSFFFFTHFKSLCLIFLMSFISSFKVPILLVFFNWRHNADSFLTSAVGLQDSYYDVIFTSYCYTVISVISQADYNHNNLLFFKYLNKVRFFSIIGLVLNQSTVILVVSKVAEWQGMDRKTQEYSLTFACMRALSAVFDLETKIQVAYLNVSNRSWEAALLLCCLFVFIPTFGFLFIHLMNLSIVGAGLSIIIADVCILCVFYRYLRRNDPLSDQLFKFDRLYIFDKPLELLKIAAPVYLYNMLNFSNFELSSVIARSLGELDYSAFVIVLQFTTTVITISSAVTQTVYLVIPQLVKEADEIKLKWNFLHFIKLAIFVCAAITISLVSFGEGVLKTLIDENDKIYYDKARLLLYVSLPYYTLDCFYSLLSAFTYCLGMYKFSLVLSIAYSFLNTSVVYFLLEVVETGVKGVFWAWIGSSAVANLILIWYLGRTLNSLSLNKNS